LASRLLLAFSSIRDWLSTLTSARACSIDMPGFNRPITTSLNAPVFRAGDIAVGTHTSVLNSGTTPVNVSGVTPMTDADTPFTVMCLPTTAGSRSK
jgi:hypothetical protein